MNIKKILRRSPTPEEIKETLLEQALEEAASKTRMKDAHKAISDTYDEFRDIAKRYPNIGKQMSDVSDRFKGASRVLGGDWQWMLQDARYKNNPLVVQAISEIIERDGLKGLKPDTVSELQRRLDVRTDLKNADAIKQNRLQKQLEEYEDLDDIVAKKFAHKEDTDVAAELMGMNPSTGESMPDRLKQAMEAIALNRGVPVVSEIDDVLNNPFVEEAVKNKRFKAYENRKIPELTNREKLIHKATIDDAFRNFRKYDKGPKEDQRRRFSQKYLSKKGLSPNKEDPLYKRDYYDRNIAKMEGQVEASNDIYSQIKRTEERIPDLLEALDAEEQEMRELLSKPLTKEQVAKYKESRSRNIEELSNELEAKHKKLDMLEEAAKKDRTYTDLGDSDVESVFDQLKDARQLEWEKPEPRYETENTLREAEYYKDPIRPTIEQRQKELIAQASKTNPKRMVPYTKYSRRGLTMEKSKINELDVLRSMYPKLKRLTPEELDLIARSVFSEHKR